MSTLAASHMSTGALYSFRRGLSLALLSLLSVGPTSALLEAEDEVRVKAAAVSKLPAFVSWPDAVWVDTPAFVLCVEEADPIRPHLESFVRGTQIRQRPAVVHVLHAESLVGRCHLVFVSARPALDIDQLLAHAATRPVLTIGEDSSFLTRGGIIRLRSVGGRLRFEADADSAKRAGLRLSSQLLRLASRVRGESE